MSRPTFICFDELTTYLTDMPKETIESLAATFLERRSAIRLTNRQADWLRDVIRKEMPDYDGGNIYGANATIEPVRIGNLNSFKLTKV